MRNCLHNLQMILLSALAPFHGFCINFLSFSSSRSAIHQEFSPSCRFYLPSSHLVYLCVSVLFCSSLQPSFYLLIIFAISFLPKTYIKSLWWDLDRGENRRVSWLTVMWPRIHIHVRFNPSLMPFVCTYLALIPSNYPEGFLR